MDNRTAEDRLRYTKLFAHILDTGNASELLQLTPNKRIHIQKALSCLARYTGKTEQWRIMRQKYGLSWSTGTEKIDAFTRLFDGSKTLEVMIEWLRQARQQLPSSSSSSSSTTSSSSYSDFLVFCTLTGLRGTECINAIRLIQDPDQFKVYYDPDRQLLQHFRFPNLFIKRTKAVYVSVLGKELLAIAQGIKVTPTLTAIKKAIRHRSLSMQVKYCRKIQASWLHKCGESAALIDVLQGRISKNIFLKHYLTLDSSFKIRILDSLHKLKQEIEQ
jgi:hypothetical protein